MPKRIAQNRYLLMPVVAMLLLVTLVTNASTFAAAPQQPITSSDFTTSFPRIDPNYIYDQLFYMATNFPHREAGYDYGATGPYNGHDDYATYWTKEIVKDLHGFGPTVRRDLFQTVGWPGYPPNVPAYNVEVTIPGVTHPEQVVYIGCHPDGKIISTQSAYDDAAGCAIELGVAKAMATYWRSQHTYPARTLRFVIFDAEEQGLIGSFHYLNETVNGDVNNMISMFNEEQNGIAYPLRYLGDMKYPLIPLEILLSPLKNNSFYPHQDKLSKEQRQDIIRFRGQMQRAIPNVFAEFRAMGYTMLTYHGKNGKDVQQPVFAANQQQYLLPKGDYFGGSDQIAFTLAGLPCSTFIGNHTYYDGGHKPPWSYPFDQPQDTIELMNTFANGSSQKAPALTLALALPGQLTNWMLTQPDILGQAPATQNPIAAISDVGQTKIKQSISLDATASFDPNGSNNLTYSWDFGDGSTVSGIFVQHTYTKLGKYTLTLTVTSPSGKTVVTKIINVVLHPRQYHDPY